MRLTLKQLLAVVVCAVLAGSAAAQDKGGASLIELERIQRLEDAIRVLNKVDAALDDMIAKRKMACTRAFGFTSFCSCLSENLPVAFSFDDYVAITTKSKEENGYPRQAADIRKAYDLVPGVRDKCVGALPQVAARKK
jgi:hypothetical protein